MSKVEYKLRVICKKFIAICGESNYRELGYSWYNIASNPGLKGCSTPRMAYNHYIENKSFESKNLQEGLRKILRERERERGIERYLLRWLGKDPFLSLERLQVPCKSFSPNNTVCELEDYWKTIE